MQAHTVSVLWIDLCADAKNAQNITVIHEMDNRFTIQSVDKDKIATSVAVAENCPHIICLDYDFPDREGLLLLRQLRCDYPSIPIIMITTQHCENLAVWAFRTGVRDYLVKPLPISSIIEVLNSLATLAKPITQNRRASRQNLRIPPLLPNEFRHGKRPLRTQRTALATCYVEAHFNESIAEKDLADLCDMSIFVFSKVFRREHNMTFREFLLRYRIERAKELLCNPAITSTDVAGLVGCSDASSFARIFRRYVGHLPSSYRQQIADKLTKHSLTTVYTFTILKSPVRKAPLLETRCHAKST